MDRYHHDELAVFLEARLAEQDESEATRAQRAVVKVCATVVARQEPTKMTGEDYLAQHVLRLLSRPYRDHPDYLPVWKWLADQEHSSLL